MAKSLKGYQKESAAQLAARDRLFKAMEANQARLSRRLVELLATLDVQGGYLVQSPENLQRLAAITAELQAGFADAAFTRAASDYVASFGSIDEGVRSYVATLGLGVATGPALQTLQQQFAAITFGYLTTGSNYATALFIPLAREVGGYIATGSRYRDLVTAAQGIVLGGEGLGRSEGALLGYAKTTVNDLATTYERTALKLASDEVGAEFYLYQGSEIDTTRPFCEDRADRYFHKKEVAKWGADAANGRGWEGMIKGTNASNVWQYLGGYNCRHVLVPVARRDVPRLELERMIAAKLIDPET